MREGETVTLVCNVTGVPVPEVTWYKIPDDGSLAKESKFVCFLSTLTVVSISLPIPAVFYIYKLLNL